MRLFIWLSPSSILSRTEEPAKAPKDSPQPQNNPLSEPENTPLTQNTPLGTNELKVCLQRRKLYDSIPYVQRFKVAMFEGSRAKLNQHTPCLKEWGWQKTDSHWYPNWSTLDKLCKSRRELVKCRCTKGCLRACSCRKVQLKCTLICHYQGECSEYICKLIPKITSEIKPNFTFMEHSGHLGMWFLLITIFDSSKFKPHNLSYCGQKHINLQEHWLIVNLKNIHNGGHLGKWLQRVTMLDFRNYKLIIQF